MNNVSEVVVTLEHYNVAVRDTLEYCMVRVQRDPNDPSKNIPVPYDVNLYNEKKRSILVEVDQHTPLKDIIDHSEEAGKNLEKSIRDFWNDIYSDNSTVVKLGKAADGSDEVRVDHNQHLKIYPYVLPIHENINNMILGILNDAHKNNIDVAMVEKLHNADEAMYRGVAMMALVGDLVRLFGDYNQARRDAKGEETPASKFIGNDITTVIQNINFVKANAKVTNAVYKNMEDHVTALVENMTGRRDLPSGKNFGDVIRDTQETIALYVRETEPAFQALYAPAINELVAQVKAQQEQQAAQQAAAPAPEKKA